MELSSGQALDLNFSQELLDSAQELMDSSQELLESSQELVETFPDEERDETHDETHDEVHDEAHSEAYDEVHDETFDEVHEVHKGQDLVGINDPLPHINKPIVFAIDDTFPNWLIAEYYVTQYGRQKGFVAIKIRCKTDHNGHLTNLYYKCEFGGTYQSKKTNNLQNQHNKGSKKINCDWKVNLSSATSMIHITSFNDHHVEHQLLPDTNIFAPVNRRFSDDCHEEIRHLVVNVIEAIQQCIERENFNEQFNLWSQERINYNDNIVLRSVFSEIVQQINKYLTPNLATEQQKQIVQSTIYHAQIFNLWDSDNSLNLQEITYNNDFIENIYDISQLYLLALIKENEYFSVKELFLTSSRNTELTPIIHQLSNAMSMNLLRIDDIQENNLQKSINKKYQYNKSMSLAKKTITLQGESENDNELDTILKNYIEKKILQHEKETKEREQRVLRENYNLENVLAVKTDNEQIISIDDVANPLRHVGKGAPRKNRIKGVQEEYQPKKKVKSNTGTGTRLCGYCHEPNHYQNMCPQKRSNLEE
ncbi:11081_t:CDS:2 [Scutellospora calospora]|uniref:11081_t:CDS:1 n=1 Tax=Scutellospora calospora TaxID=85575 RepID=A0ACA9KC98_9GLOM|nr:11081_t:CDS:2 [Scutellospora calospora]